MPVSSVDGLRTMSSAAWHKHICGSGQHRHETPRWAWHRMRRPCRADVADSVARRRRCSGAAAQRELRDVSGRWPSPNGSHLAPTTDAAVGEQLRMPV